MPTPVVSPRNPFSLVQEAQQSVPVNVAALARQFGIALSWHPMHDDIAGTLAHDREGWCITVNAAHEESRQRFTIAHEIGHFVLHRNRLGRGTNDSRRYAVTAEAPYYNDRIDTAAETEANRFATALLMPEDRVVDVCRIFRCNEPEPVARLFQVSPHAMTVRMAHLRQRGRL